MIRALRSVLCWVSRGAPGRDGLSHTSHLLVSLLMELRDCVLFLFEQPKAVNEWIGDLKTVTLSRALLLVLHIVQRLLHLLDRCDDALAFLDKLILLTAIS